MARTIFEFNGYLLDSGEQRFQKDGIDIQLPPRVFAVLEALVENQGQLISNDDILQTVWKETFVEEGNIRYCVHSLRKILGDGFIETVPKRGYRFIAEVNAYSPDEFIRKYAAVPAEKVETKDPSPINYGSKRRIAFGAVFALGILLLYLQVQTGGENFVSSQTSHFLQHERITASGRAYFVGLSLDDQHAAYVVHTEENKYSLVLHNLPSGSETTIIAPQDLQIFSVQFSPDGKYIYYSAHNTQKRAAVFRIPLYGGSPQRITDELAHCFSISPDGEWLAFYRRVPEAGTHELKVCRSADCGELRTVTTRGNGSGFAIWGASPSWSSDGNKLLSAGFTKDPNGERAQHHLIETDVFTGESATIAGPEWNSVHQAYWSKDGREILVLVREAAGDPVQIWRLNYPSGAAERITNDVTDYREFRPSSDFSFLVASTWSRSENLFLVPVSDPNSARQLTFDVAGSNGAWGIKWTPDGKQLVHTRADGYQTGNLWRLDLETLESFQLTFDKGVLPLSIDVNPDGDFAVFSSNRTGNRHIWQVDLDGKNLRQMSPGEGALHPEISPDGKWLYFGAKGLWKMPIEGGEAIQVMEEGTANHRISPTDPTRFVGNYYDRTAKDQPYKLGLFTENDTSNVKDLNLPGRIFEWKPDGSGVYYIDSSGESFGNIWFLSLKDMKPVQVTNFADQVISNFSLSPDGRTIAASRGAAIGNIVKIKIRK